MPSEQRPFVRFAVWLSAFCWFCAGPAAAQNNPSGEPPQVVAVRVVTESGAVLQQNPSQLTPQPGQPFSMETESASLRELFRSGRYADLRAELRTCRAECAWISLSAKISTSIACKSKDCANRPARRSRCPSLRLNLGEIFRESDMKDAVDRLRQTLEDDGQYQAMIDLRNDTASRHASDGHHGARDPGPAGTNRRHHHCKTRPNFPMRNFAGVSSSNKEARSPPID